MPCIQKYLLKTIGDTMNIKIPGSSSILGLNKMDIHIIFKRLVSMQIIAFALAALCIMLSARQAKAQNVTLAVKNGKVRDIMSSISRQTSILIEYSEDPYLERALEEAKPISIQVDKAHINHVLQICNRDQNFVASYEKGVITVAPRLITVRAKIIDQRNEGVNDVLITVIGTNKKTTSDANGSFTLENVYANANLLLTSVNIEDVSIKVAGKGEFTIPVQHEITEFDEANVTVNLGYLYVYKRMGTSSINNINKNTISQRVSTSVLDQLNGRVPGLMLVTNPIPGTYQSKEVTVGARSTLYNVPDPLIVVDNFPFDGSLSDLNPDEIESVSILKDATASSIWGARAGNGVIVVTTKQAKHNKKLNIAVNSWIATLAKPNLFYEKLMSSTDLVAIQKKLYENNFYLPLILSDAHPALPPVAEILAQNRSGIISDFIRDSTLAAWSNHDNRHEQQKLFYRNSLVSHNYLQLNGGSNTFAFSVSGGYDYTLPQIKGGKKERWTLDAKNLIRLRKNLELQGGVGLITNKDRNLDLPILPPTYLPLQKDGKDFAYDYERRSYYIDTVSRNGDLLDWHYRPVEEFRLRNKTTTTTNLRIMTGLRWKVMQGVDIQLLYQFQKVEKEIKDLKYKNTYEVRNLVNAYSQLNNGNIYRVIPYNDILDLAKARSPTHNIRGMVTYSIRVKNNDSLLILGGYDGIWNHNFVSSSREYSYNSNSRLGQNDLNYRTQYPLYYAPSQSATIPYNDAGFAKYTGFVSYYASANYNWKRKYFFSGSIRLDKSTLFGDSTNGKALFLYSGGLAWDIHSERFYHIKWLPLLKFRATYGIAGNTPVDVSSVTTIRYNGVNGNGDPTASINNPPLPLLRWEEVGTFNMGLNFRLTNGKVDGSLDWYHKVSDHLLANHEIDPTTGNRFAMGNVASMKSNHVDFVLNNKILDRKFRWYTHFLLTYIKEKVSGSKDSLMPAWYYCDLNYFTVVPNRDPYSIYSFKYGGLDPNNGDPIGFNRDDKSKNYATILTQQGYSELRYHGRSTPGIFGSLTNEFIWKDFTFSFTLLYKLNYYFHRKSINYYGVYHGYDYSSADYEKRWQTTGDEKKTQIPSEPTDYLNVDKNRDIFFNLSEINVEKGDHIRIENLYVGYELDKKTLKKLSLNSATIYVSMNNIGILWRANRQNIDPDKLSGIPQPRMYAFGLKLAFEKQN